MITIYKPADVQINVIDGEPPVDQSEEVATLQAALADMTAQRDALQTKIDQAIAILQA